ncbi:hypothetical protein CTRI78_v007983 [Colletotrichum trifolii]|uniref:Six-hairpin glycosidase n=1 Tax=Colletotrichum trifolii TaxID=5466 RepID=A0A4V3HUT7_COLTR|nr:hypothetical protein CTRI78_v007983 [Colletotrichum trifolii]
MKALLVLILSTLLIAGADLASQECRINTNDKTGAMDKITDPRSNNAVNWDSLYRSFWNFPQFTKRDGVVEAVYTTGGLELLARRSVNDDDGSFTESYTFENKGVEALDLDSKGTTALAAYTPFNDHCTNTTDCVTARSLAHIWANGGASSWVKLDQMGSNYRNLGLVLTKSALAGHSVGSRDSVTMWNTRGVSLLDYSIPTPQPGEASAFEWTWFWHGDWEDFFEQSAVRSKQFIRVKSNSYTFVRGETGSITLSGASVNSNARVYGQAVQCADGVCQYNFTAGKPAQTTQTFSTDSGYNATAYLNTVPAHDDVLDSRTRFIIENQQDSTPNKPAEGAYRVFDNQAMVLATWDTSTDRNPGRERVGMGILMARWLKKNPDNEGSGFVRDRPSGMDGGRKRLHDWPWVQQFHFTVAALDLNLAGPVADETPLERFMMTLENFYAEGGAELYAIGLPILGRLRTLEAHGNQEWLGRARELYEAHAEHIAQRGVGYPEFEVNFEQFIVAPAAVMLLELWRYTSDDKWLEAARLHLDTMLCFAGKQPYYRLHDVSIRHWDGFWFGKDRVWGDTFPHHWSTINAVALHHYGKGLGNDTDAERWPRTADGFIRNNLALFEASGKASCAYIYPASASGRNGNYRDHYAND